MRFQFRLTHLMWFVVAVAIELGLFRWAPQSMFMGLLALAIWCGLALAAAFVGEDARNAARRALDRRWPDEPSRWRLARVVKSAFALGWGLLVAVLLWSILVAFLVSIRVWMR